MNKKDMLIIFNIFGIQKDQEAQVSGYVKTLEEILWHVEDAKEFSIRVVVAANMVTQFCAEKLKERFEDKITIIKFDLRSTCQIITNRAITAAIEEFKEEYESYFYVSSGLSFPKQSGAFSGIIDRMNSSKYGILQMQTNNDHGYHFLGQGSGGWFNIDFERDYDIPPGNHANFHSAVIHNKMRDFYGMAVTDVHGKCGMESVLSYCCAALKMKYTLMGGFVLTHIPGLDTLSSIDWKTHPEFRDSANQGIINVPCHTQMFNRDKTAIARDPEAISCGIGYYPGELANNTPDWNGVILEHKKEKFDENYFSLDDNMKTVAKRYFYSNEKEVSYSEIKYKIY
jgi:hypothetical protein